jgi:UDP-3-O-[3-hydroxymyristoyl] glucosamine N-acyltransferase
MKIKELAVRLGCPFEGDGDKEVWRVAAPEAAALGDIIYIAKERLLPLLEATAASAVILAPGMDCARLPVIRSSHPQMTFVMAAGILHPAESPAAGIHPSAVIAPSARVGEGVAIGPLCVVGEAVEIGTGTVLYPHVTVYAGVKIGPECVLHSGVHLREGVRIGARVILHNGVVIGADGFGYLRAEDGTQVKIPQLGTVIIEDHNVEIGENAILVAQVGIAGSAKIGRGAILSGQVGVPDHVTIGEGAIIAAKTGVTGNIPAGGFVSGSPHLDIRVWRKFWASAPRLYDLVKEFKRRPGLRPSKKDRGQVLTLDIFVQTWPRRVPSSTCQASKASGLYIFVKC